VAAELTVPWCWSVPARTIAVEAQPDHPRPAPYASAVRPTIHRLAIVLLLAALPVAGCAKKKSKAAPPPAPFAGAEVAKTIDEQLPKTFGGLRVGPASCPGTVDPQQDKPGFCTMTVEGLPVRVRVERADGGKFRVASDQAVIPVDQLERAMGPLVSQKGGQPFTVDCGDEAVKVFDPPGKINCVATPARGAPRRLLVTVQDKKGNFTFEEAKEG
jgi:hypothetical protein